LATPATIAAAIALIGAGYLALLGPLAVRNDLRQDLAYLPVLRTFPLPGHRVVLAEVLSPTLALSAVQLALILTAYLLTLGRVIAIDIPLATRTLALAVRLFGNMMSGVMIVGILLTITPYFFPIVMTALGLLTGMVQAYIFSILAAVYVTAATRTQSPPGTKGIPNG